MDPAVEDGRRETGALAAVPVVVVAVGVVVWGVTPAVTHPDIDAYGRGGRPHARVRSCHA